MTKSEKTWLGIVSNEGCVVCYELGYRNLPQSPIHHLRFGVGGGQKNSNYATMGLCRPHHQQAGHGVSFHDGQEAWEKKYGKEMELYERLVGRIVARYGRDLRPEGFEVREHPDRVIQVKKGS